jgi:outer membrane protein OmpA-like peptidoglycan-associated protein
VVRGRRIPGTRLALALIAVVPATLLGGCGQKSTEPTAMPVVAAPAESTAQPQRPVADSTVPKQFIASPPMALPGAAPAPPAAREFTDEPALKDVLFGPGRTDIDSIGARVVQGNARWMRDYPDSLILVEGHSDSKGTRASNLEAGERRAKAAASALVKQGAPGPRLWIVSYGSDRPVCAEKTDACAAKNRRVHFKVKKLQ